MKEKLPQLAVEIREVTEKLHDIHEQLQWATAGQVNLSRVLDLDTLNEFKTALDHARHVVWPQILGFEQRSPENVLYALQLYRMQRIREMLQVLQQDEAALGEQAKIQLFLAEIHRLISGKLDS